MEFILKCFGLFFFAIWIEIFGEGQIWFPVLVTNVKCLPMLVALVDFSFLN